MDKYYNPTIEEFHQGFEYEIWESFAYTKENWIKETFQFVDENGIWLGEDPTNILAMYENRGDEIRVKYLSKEDIESLGFKLKSKSIDLWFEREGIYLRDDGHHLNNIKLQYGLHDQRLKITFNYISGEEQIHFEGTIKNKSELIKLIKMLNID